MSKHPLIKLVEKLHYHKGANFKQCFIAAYEKSNDGVLAYWAASKVTQEDPLRLQVKGNNNHGSNLQSKR